MRSVAAKSQYQTIPLASIHESTTNPRKTFDEAKLAELAYSIRTQGLIQPITVRPNSDGYEIVAGARRFRAAQLAALDEIAARVVNLSDEQALEWTLIENSQRVDVHPYEEAQGFQRLLDLPGYEVATLVEKTGKSESLIYSRLALLSLIPEVAEAFESERITVSHANLIARLPKELQVEAFAACWRKTYQDTEALLLPAKYLSAWISNNVYLPLGEAPFDTEDASLNESAGACLTCPKRSGFNTALFADVAGDQCFDADCYRAKVSAHVTRTLAARPELVKIETNYHHPDDEREEDALSPNHYIEVEPEAADEEEEDAEETTSCQSAKEAIVVYGRGAGTVRKVCTDRNCPVHFPARVIPINPESERRREEQRKEQERRARIEKRRKATLERIFEHAPASLTAAHLRVLLRALVNIRYYDFADDVAVHYTGDDENNQQSAEEVLMGVADRLTDDQLPQLIMRIALTSHAEIPREDGFDHLAEAAKVFLPQEQFKPKARKVQQKGAKSKPTQSRGKIAKKKTTKRSAA